MPIPYKDTPDIPALRSLSAERLVVGDRIWGFLQPADAQGWALIEQDAKEVLDLTFVGADLAVRIKDGDGGERDIPTSRDAQVLIEFR